MVWWKLRSMLLAVPGAGTQSHRWYADDGGARCASEPRPHVAACAVLCGRARVVSRLGCCDRRFQKTAPTRRLEFDRAAGPMMHSLLALLFPCAVPTALPTIFYLEHGHEHVPAEAHGSLRGAKVETVAAVPPSRLADMLVGFPPGQVAAKWEQMSRGFRELARLVSHLEALRQASASLPPDANPSQPEAIGMIMDRPSFAFEKYWGTGANLRLSDWVAAAPLDWQVLQLSLVPAHGQWAAVDALPLELPPTAAWQRWAGTAGLHCYVFKASFARCATTVARSPTSHSWRTLPHTSPHAPSCSATHSTPSSPSPLSSPLAAAT